LYLGILYPQLQRLVRMIREAEQEGRPLEVDEVISKIAMPAGV
jgi:hypothetical protein